MQIGINGRVLLFPVTGVAKRLINLIFQINQKESHFDFTIFSQKKINIKKLKNINNIVNNFPNETIWQNFIIPSQLKKKSINIYHSCWGGGLPVVKHKKSAVYLTTFHDTIILDFLESNIINNLTKRQFYNRTQKNLTLSDQVIAVSEYTKGQLLKYFKIKEEKITVIPNGITTDFRKLSKNEKINFQNQLPEQYKNRPFLLYIGGFNKRKNVESLLKSFEHIKEKFSDHFLILGGALNAYFKKNLQKIISEKNLSNRIFLPGYIDEKDLVYYYNYAEFLIYPSLSEGFGMPVLEAMACGCPVIADNSSSIPEITQNSGLLINASDNKILSDAMELLIQKPDLKEKLSASGIIRSASYRWPDIAEKLINVYKIYE